MKGQLSPEWRSQVLAHLKEELGDYGFDTKQEMSYKVSGSVQITSIISPSKSV